MTRIAVAATAPFGADVLERLAARARDRRPAHPARTRLGDAGAGSQRPPRRTVAERLGMPVLQPERPEAGLDLGAPSRRRLRLRPPDPGGAARGGHLAQRPSVAPAALAWRGPVERAILAGDARDRGDDPRDREGARRRPDRRAGGVPDRARRRRRRGVRPVPQSWPPAPRCRARRPEPIFVPQAPTASPTPRRSSRADRLLDLERPAEELVRRVRALSPHIGARAELHGRPVTVWRARVGEDGAFEPLEVQPDGGKRMDAAAWLRGLR